MLNFNNSAYYERVLIQSVTYDVNNKALFTNLTDDTLGDLSTPTIKASVALDD